MPSNTSYIDSSSDYAELWNFLDKRHIYDLVAQVDTEVEDTLSDDLSASQQDRLNQALNFGRSWIDTALGELYEVTDLDYTDAADVIKDLNARLAQHFLERRRLRSGEAPTETLADLKRELMDLASESTPFSLTWTRKGGIVAGTESKATQFDDSDQFGNIIPQSDQYEIWPDLANQ